LKETETPLFIIYGAHTVTSSVQVSKQARSLPWGVYKLAQT